MTQDEIEPEQLASPEEAMGPSFSARDDVAAIESLVAFGVCGSVLVVVWASGMTLIVAVLVTIVVAPFALSFLAEALGDVPIEVVSG